MSVSESRFDEATLAAMQQTASLLAAIKELNGLRDWFREQGQEPYERVRTLIVPTIAALRTPAVAIYEALTFGGDHGIAELRKARESARDAILQSLPGLHEIMQIEIDTKRPLDVLATQVRYGVLAVLAPLHTELVNILD